MSEQPKVSDEEIAALLTLADWVDTWLIDPTPRKRNALAAARDNLARIRSERSK